MTLFIPGSLGLGFISRNHGQTGFSMRKTAKPLLLAEIFTTVTEEKPFMAATEEMDRGPGRARTSSDRASSGLVAVGAARARRVEEQEWLLGQVLERDADNVPCANEPGLRVTYGPLGLEASLPEPPVREGEALAAVVILAVLEPNQVPLLEDGAGLGHAVRNAREQLRQVERGVGVVIDPEQEHLPIQLVHMTDGTLGNVGWKRKGAGRHPLRLGAGRREGEQVGTSHDPGEPPEGIRHDAEVR
jgi:hypothetical protein